MEPIIVPAYAKVNLSLAVTGRRADGYHLLETVFQRISLCDRLIIQKTDIDELALQCSLPGVLPQENIIAKAYRTLKKATPALGGLSVTLEKHIPVQAGLGGGSADCAAFLIAANQLYHLGLSRQELMILGTALGADVPACMLPGASLGCGIGEKLQPINSRMPLWFVIVKPQAAFSTTEMFRRLDRNTKSEQRFTARAVATALKKGELDALCQNLYNVFESVVEEPIIEEIKAALLQQGAKGTLMTGSGSCVFGLFAEQVKAKEAAAALSPRWLTFACHSQNEE